ncbi:hypothetical protein HAX54_043945 [Datura stramonium]|uniref:Uncharacterized protein n=1 Tax=Datura stramonium TaxID=4076 RepID=A0ABS8W5Z5_DATST|nr:hypothetical protein [Datura stramonium]
MSPKGKTVVSQRAGANVSIAIERESIELPRTQGMHTRSQGHSAGHPTRPSSPSLMVDPMGDPEDERQEIQVTGLTCSATYES